MNTYVDKETGRIHDYGVQVYFPYENALDFFSQLNVTLVPRNPRSNNTVRYVDFTTGQEVVGFKPVDPVAGIMAIRKFHDLTIEKGYDKMIQPGYWDLPAGDKIPEDLLLPVGQLVKKYGVEAMLPMMYPITGGDSASRSGGFENLLSLTLLKAFPTAWMKAFLGDVPLYSVVGGNQVLFDTIAAFLGDSNILYNTMVLETERSSSGVKLHVRGRNGLGEKLVRARALLMAAPPTRENMAPFDLDEAEKALFAKTRYGRSHVGIVRHTKMPKNITYQNTPASAALRPLEPFVTVLPFVSNFAHYSGDSNLYSVGAGGHDFGTFDDAAAQELVRQSLQTMATAGKGSNATGTSVLPDLGDEPLEVVAWADHGPGGFGVSAQDMRDGWMSDFYGLQGKKSTWFTGGTIAADFTTMLWKFNDILLPKMVGNL